MGDHTLVYLSINLTIHLFLSFFPSFLPVTNLISLHCIALYSIRFACTHKSSWTANSVEENSICGAFDAIKIRNAFLRVFVVLLTEYVESYTAAATSAGSSSVVPNGSSHGHGHGGLSRSSSSHTMDDGIASAIIPYMDGKESYLKGVKENIITINQRNSNSSITTSSSIAETAPGPKKRISFLKLGLSSKKTEPDVDKKVNPFRKTKETDRYVSILAGYTEK